MTAIIWDAIGERTYETGVDQGVLYPQDTDGSYPSGVGWNGLTTVTETPSGAEATAQYADNIQYLNLVSIELFGGTIEALTYPDEFEQCDGTAQPSAGVTVGQQNRKAFGLSYRTRKGNDVEGSDFGYKLHLVYAALAKPSEKAFETINDTPKPIGFSWEFTTSPVAVSGLKPTALMTIDSTLVDPTALASLEAFLYGTEGASPRLPLPDEVIALFAATATVISPAKPAFASNIVTIPTVTGALYYYNDVLSAAGAKPALATGVSADVRVEPAAGYVFPALYVNEWQYTGV